MKKLILFLTFAIVGFITYGVYTANNQQESFMINLTEEPGDYYNDPVLCLPKPSHPVTFRSLASDAQIPNKLNTIKIPNVMGMVDRNLSCVSGVICACPINT